MKNQDYEPDLLAIKLVAVDGHHMPLKGLDRLEAIRLMSELNIGAEEMSWRLCIQSETLRTIAKRANIQLPVIRPKAHWTVHYTDRFKSRRKTKNGKQQR